MNNNTDFLTDFTPRQANQLAIILADICRALDLPTCDVDASGTSQLMLEINAGIEARKKLAALSPPADLAAILTRLDFLHRTIAGRPDNLQEWEKHVAEWRKEINEAWPQIRDSLDSHAIEVETITRFYRELFTRLEASEQRVTDLEKQLRAADALNEALERQVALYQRLTLGLQGAAPPTT